MMWFTTRDRLATERREGIINQTGSATKTQKLGDAVIGTYGQFGLGQKWSIPFYLDAGTGDPNFTWQGLSGVKYGNLALSYRFLDSATAARASCSRSAWADRNSATRSGFLAAATATNIAPHFCGAVFYAPGRISEDSMSSFLNAGLAVGDTDVVGVAERLARRRSRKR